MFSRIKFFSAGLALVLLSITGATALAQQTANPDANQLPGANGQRPQRRGQGRGFRHGPGRGGKYGPRLLNQLNLTEEQRKQVRAITEETFQSRKGEREELRQLGEKRRQGTLTADEQARGRALHQQLRAAMAATQTRIGAILTADQTARAEELIKERKANSERFRGRFGRKPGEPLGGDPILANPPKKP